MPPRNWKMRIQDILDSIAAIREYTTGTDFESFLADRKTMDAVVRNFTIIGEAARNVPSDISDSHPEVPWKLMRDFRNVIVHEYFGVDTKTVWATLTDNLPPLVPLLEKLLREKHNS